MKRTKKILMICYFFPPIQTSGTLRSLEFARHLKGFGYHPVVLTVESCQEPMYHPLAEVPQDIEIHRTKEINIKTLLKWVDRFIILLPRLCGKRPEVNYAEEFFALPDLQISWKKIAKGKEIGRDCDCIYVSCSPFSSALAGITLKKALGIPLIVDFRDAWSNWVEKRTAFKTFVVSKLERYFVKHADIFIANTPRAGDYYKKRYPEFESKIRVITNGFDVANVPEKACTKPFRVVHIGSFYGGRQPDLLFRALAELNLKDVEFVQVGGEVLVPKQLDGKIKCTRVSSVPHDEALRLMQSASLLYLKQSWSRGGAENFAIAQKTYEYLATGLPILVEAPESDNTDIVQKCCAYPYIVSSDSLELMKSELTRAYDDRYNVAPRLTDESIRRFSRQALAEVFKNIIEEVCIRAGLAL